MKIFLGVDGLGRYGELLKVGLESYGHIVTLCDSRPTRDITYMQPDLSIKQIRSKGIQRLVYCDDCKFYIASDWMFSFINNFDVFIFFFADTLFPACQDIPLLHLLGKKIMCISAGEDSYIPEVELAKATHTDRSFAWRLLARSHREPDSYSALVNSWYSSYQNISRKLHLIRTIEFSGQYLAQTNASAALRKPYSFPPLFCDPVLVDKFLDCDVKLKGCHPLYISHFASNIATKNTISIKKAISQIESKLNKKEASDCIFNIYPKLRQDFFFKKVSESSVVIDGLSGMGSVTRQSIALGTVPVTGLHDYDKLGDPYRRCYSIQCRDADELVSSLYRLIKNRDELLSLYTNQVLLSRSNLSPKNQSKHINNLLNGDSTHDVLRPWGETNFIDCLRPYGGPTELISKINDYIIADRIYNYTSKFYCLQ
jgi:hypothetical protein